MKEIAGIIDMVLTRVTTIVLADGERAIADRPALESGTISNSSEGGEKEPATHLCTPPAEFGREETAGCAPAGETGAGDAAGMGNGSGGISPPPEGQSKPPTGETNPRLAMGLEDVTTIIPYNMAEPGGGSGPSCGTEISCQTRNQCAAPTL
jgi:hypothetical protein